MLKQKLSTPLIVLLIIISFGLHTFIYELLKTYTSSFMIKKISVTGTVLSQDMQFDNIVNAATNSVQGNLTYLDIKELKRQLEKIDLIKQATIKRDLPNTLSIDIIERQPVAILRTKSTNYTIDKEGIVLSLIPNITIPALKIEYGIAMNGNQIADDFLLRMLKPLASKKSTNIQEIRIDKNRKTFFKLHHVRPEFSINDRIISDEYIEKAVKIGHTLTNNNIKIPKIIDIYSYTNRSIGFY